MREEGLLDIKINIPKLPIKVLEQYPEIFEKETMAAMWRWMLVLASAVRERTPEGATKLLKRSIQPDVKPLNLRGQEVNLRGEVTSLWYGEFVELGTDPHYPPRREILYWVSRKLGLSGMELRRATRAIQWHIYQHGTKGVHMFEEGFKETEDQGLAFINQAIDNMLNQIGRAFK